MVTTIYKLISLLMIISIITACSTPASRDPSSQYFDIPITTQISLLKKVTIPANTAHIYFQGGVVSSPKATNQYHPFCRFEVNQLSEAAQIIMPNLYTLKRIRSDYEVVSMPDTRLYYTEFRLSSDKDKNVRSLKCGQWARPDDSITYLTIKQMQDSLGSYMTIKLPESVKTK